MVPCGNGHAPQNAKIISKTFIHVLREAPGLHCEDGTVLWSGVMQKMNKRLCESSGSTMVLLKE